MIHDENRWVVKWTVHNTQLFSGIAPSKTYFYSFEKVCDAIYYLYCQRKLVWGNNLLLLPLSSSLLQKSLGQKEGVKPWLSVVDFWGDLASFHIFLCGSLAKRLKLFPFTNMPGWHGALRTQAAHVPEVNWEVYGLGSLHYKIMPSIC